MTQDQQMAEDTKRVLEAVDRLQSETTETRLANGIVLQILPFPHELMRRALRAIERPKPPMIEINGEQEENPADPDYLQSIDDFDDRRMRVLLDVLRARGTRLKSIPDGLQRPEDDGWIEDARFVGVEPDLSSPTRRYLEWLDLYAIDRQADSANLTASLLLKYGMLESEVSEAIVSFRDRAKRRAFDFLSTEETSINGDPVQG